MNTYLENIKRGLSSHFDIRAGLERPPFLYDLFCEMRVRHSRYALLKEVKIYEFETKEFFLIRRVHPLGVELLGEELQVLKEDLGDIVNPHGEQRSSLVTLVHVSEEEIHPSLEAFIKGFRYQRGFALGLKGWVDLGLIAVSLKDKKVVANRVAKKRAPFFQPGGG